jgi:hypothetical protein
MALPRLVSLRGVWCHSLWDLRCRTLNPKRLFAGNCQTSPCLSDLVPHHYRNQKILATSGKSWPSNLELGSHGGVSRLGNSGLMTLAGTSRAKIREGLAVGGGRPETPLSSFG